MFSKSKLRIVTDAICGILFLLSMLVYILVGVFTGVWHPTWVIILCTCIACAVISIISNAVINYKKKNNKISN